MRRAILIACLVASALMPYPSARAGDVGFGSFRHVPGDVEAEGSDTYRILINQVNVTRAEVVISGALGTLADRVDDARFRTH
jgi:hypothetical protein